MSRRLYGYLQSTLPMAWIPGMPERLDHRWVPVWAEDADKDGTTRTITLNTCALKTKDGDYVASGTVLPREVAIGVYNACGDPTGATASYS